MTKDTQTKQKRPLKIIWKKELVLFLIPKIVYVYSFFLFLNKRSELITTTVWDDVSKLERNQNCEHFTFQ